MPRNLYFKNIAGTNTIVPMIHIWRNTRSVDKYFQNPFNECMMLAKYFNLFKTSLSSSTKDIIIPISFTFKGLSKLPSKHTHNDT